MRLLFAFVAAMVSPAMGLGLTTNATVHNQTASAKPIIRGVSLGGWLVLEPWITPKFFETANEGVQRNADNSYTIVDEFTYRSQGSGTHDRQAMIEDHWNTFVTKDHMSDISAAGLTHVRIPVGYWYFKQFDNEPFSQNSGDYAVGLAALKTLVNDWAPTFGLKVLIDLHTAPGSQNGFDNSGRRGPTNVLKDGNLERWAEALDAMVLWCSQNLDESSVWGIEPLNEPAGFNADIKQAVLNTINPTGYSTVRKYYGVETDVQVVLQTAFIPIANLPSYPEPQYHNVWFDDHNYQCFGDYFNNLALKRNGWPTHLDTSCGNKDGYSKSSLYAVGGEWSLAVTDCTKYLTGGMNNGCDMNNDPSCEYRGKLDQNGNSDTCVFYNQPYSQFTDSYKTFLRNFASAQMDSFEAANGWFFWNFHTEDNHAPEWDYLLGWQEGWMPKDASNRETFCK